MLKDGEIQEAASQSPQECDSFPRLVRKGQVQEVDFPRLPEGKKEGIKTHALCLGLWG